MVPIIRKFFCFSLFAALTRSSVVCTVNQEVKTASIVANNKFALALLKQLHSSDENSFFSPQSIGIAIAMTSLGARENTLSEIDAAFHFDSVKNVSSDPMDLHECFKAFMHSYEGANATFDLVFANRLFSAPGIGLLSQFVEDTEKYYKAGIQQINFSGGGAEQIINSWVAEKTHDLIKDLFQPGSLGGGVILVLVNAIYFKGVWVHEFTSETTSEKDFHVTANVAKKVEMMSRDEVEVPYYNDVQRKLELVELPYMGDKLSMVILLPEQGGLTNLVANLTSTTFDDLLSKLSLGKVNIKIPKFKVEADYSLVDTLRQLGVHDLFSHSADLSGITNGGGTKVSEVQHKTFIEVDEMGTKAAAGSGVVIVKMAPQPCPSFVADRPFLFFIIENTSVKRILFAGVLREP